MRVTIYSVIAAIGVLALTSCFHSSTGPFNVHSPKGRPQFVSGADPCSLSRKVLTASITTSGVRNGRRLHKRTIPVTMTFLGNQVALHDSVLVDTGIVFEFGRTLDLMSDPRQNKDRWKQLWFDERLHVGSAIGHREGDLVSLSWSHSTANRQSPSRLLSVTGQDFTIRTNSCENTCQLLAYHSYERSQGSSQERNLVASTQCTLTGDITSESPSLGSYPLP